MSIAINCIPAFPMIMRVDTSRRRRLGKWQSVLRHGLLAILLSSCEQPTMESGEAGGTQIVSTRPPDAIPVIRNPSTARVPVAFSVGSTKFIAPTEIVGFQVGYQGENVDFVTLGVVLPDFVGKSLVPSTERIDHVSISLNLRHPESPLDLPNSKEEAESLFASWYPDSRYTKSVNEKLGLIEIKYKDNRDYVAYRRNDDYVRRSDNRVPTVTCSGGRVNLCRGFGYLPPDIEVRYQFRGENIALWEKIDAGVLEYIDRIRQENH